jgi:hypothetical protein
VYFVRYYRFQVNGCYRDKKVVGVFVRFRAPVQGLRIDLLSKKAGHNLQWRMKI